MLGLTRQMVIAATLAAGVATVGCSQPAKTQPKEVKKEGDRNAAPDFALKDVNGQTVKLSDYRGKVVLLNFWATWCAPCKIEIPWFMDFEKKYKDQGFAVLGVAMDEEGWEVVKPYLEQKKVNYRVMMGDDSTAQLFGGVEALPTTFVLDRDGRIASTHVGLVSKSDYETEIVDLLAKKSGRLGGGPVLAFGAAVR